MFFAFNCRADVAVGNRARSVVFTDQARSAVCRSRDVSGDAQVADVRAADISERRGAFGVVYRGEGQRFPVPVKDAGERVVLRTQHGGD